MPPPLACFLTWTTYGTRLHGDVRGTVNITNNKQGAPCNAPDGELEQAMSESMVYEPVVLNDAMREVVQSVMREHMRIRGWAERALNVRTTHVHVVVDCRGERFRSPERVMQEFKYWGTRRLREGGHILPVSRTWTDHGSTRWINGPAQPLGSHQLRAEYAVIARARPLLAQRSRTTRSRPQRSQASRADRGSGPRAAPRAAACRANRSGPCRPLS